MNPDDLPNPYDFSGQTVVVTGGGGVLCAELARGLAARHANMVLLDREVGRAEQVLGSIGATQGKHRALYVDVIERASVEQAAEQIQREYGRIDALVNGAGGNHPKATTNPEQPFFDIPADAIQFVTNLNLLGTIVTSQVFAQRMATQRSGVILNVSSMNAYRPLTRIFAYSAAKAAVSNFTQWLAVHLAQEYSTNIRVNALAPGFFLTEQNRFLLTEEGSGALTQRGQRILDHTPLGRFGSPRDLLGATLWLLSPASAFVTGVVIPIDGGFSAYSGV